jgi:CubicO group peptidase (beta-lactamase class C family)
VSGFVRSRLARVHDVLARHTESGEIPGAVALIARGNETHVAVAGECRRDTIFRISSMTKPVTAAAAMICVEECALRLDDPVDALLPELAARRVLTQVDAPLSYTVPAVRPITVRDLLTFTFGLGQVITPETLPITDALAQLSPGPPAPALAPAPDEWMRRFGALPLMYQPGERWLYNTGADVLGVLIARASGQRLGMTDTGFSVPAADLPRLPAELMTDVGTGETAIFEGGVRARARRLRHYGLGVRRQRGDQAGRAGQVGGQLRLGRRARYVVVQRSGRGPDRYPDDPADVDLASPRRHFRRFLDVGLSGHRRLIVR